MSKNLASPGVTAVIPTFNRAEFVREAIESVASQDFEPLEIVVVDDGSTDGTPAVLADLREKSTRPMKVIRQANAGEAAARNAGTMAATHDLVAFLDSDNRWRAGKLAAQVEHLTEGDYPFSFTAYTEFGPGVTRPQTIRVDDWHDDPVSALRRLLIGCLVNTSTVIARRDVLVDAGLFDASLVYCVDHDLWFKVAAKGYRIGYLDVPLTDYRIHRGSVSQHGELVATTTVHVIERLFREHDLPAEMKAEESVHLARWYLNSACRYIEAKQPREARSALWRALRSRPAAIRPGWLCILLRSMLVRLTQPRRERV